jgi:serine/threonine-protein kinase
MLSYRAGLQALHDANRDAAESSFLAASEADPGMGAAHLRYALLHFMHERASVAHAHFLTATGLRATLGPGDVALLDAFAPVFDQQPPDWAATEQRLAAARARSPADTEVLYELAMVELQRNELREAILTADAALAIDPKFAGAMLVKEAALEHEGDTDGVAKAADRCLEASPEAAACVGLRIEALSPAGRCEEVERDARRLIAINPASPAGFYAQAQAGAALGWSPDGLLESFKAEWKHQGDAAKWAEAFDRASLAALTGDGAALGRDLDALARVADEGRDAFEHMNAAWMRVEASTELGDTAGAAAAAESFLDKKNAWQEDPGVDMQAIAFDVVPMMLRAEREGGKVSEAELEQRRGQWLEKWRARIHPTLKGYLWVYGYAQTVRTPAEARAALAALPAFTPLPRYRPSFLADASIGRTYLLAGKADDAVPLLESVTSRCDPFEDPFVYVHASLWLGEALEATGDPAGACASYDRVRKAWSGLGPRSITLREARARASALRCAEAK